MKAQPKTTGIGSLLLGLSLALASCQRATQSAGLRQAEADTGADNATLEPIGPVVDGWVDDDTDAGVRCEHPRVEAHCEAGWCRIPAGCFIMGSPETELGRGMYTELLKPVTLTHSFEIGQYEVTRKQWSGLVPKMPVKPPQVIAGSATCVEPLCPLRYASWFEALHFANLLSENHVPPLAPCYGLANCQGDPGTGMFCSEVSITASTIYECEGYRLPTEAEWEYAARAGTRTAYYSGDITYSGDNVTDTTQWGESEPNLESVAWYDKNSALTTHEVGQKRPNRWMLFDMLGNVAEWTSDRTTFHDYPGPVSDPATEIGLDTEVADSRDIRGGNASGLRTWLRAAGRDYDGPESASGGTGFRLVRTLK
jgi:sulfatase modifying factor 1